MPGSSFKEVCIMIRNVSAMLNNAKNISAMLNTKVYLKVYMCTNLKIQELKSPGLLEFRVINVMNRHSFFLSLRLFTVKNVLACVQINNVNLHRLN